MEVPMALAVVGAQNSFWMVLLRGCEGSSLIPVPTQAAALRDLGKGRLYFETSGKEISLFLPSTLGIHSANY